MKRFTEPHTDSLLQSIQAALEAQPFSRLLGAKLRFADLNPVEFELPISERVTQQNGFVHGGVISYAADNALAIAGASALGDAVVTSEFKINYLRPARGQLLLARAHVVHAGRTQAVCRCEVFTIEQARETLCAVAQGTIVRLAPTSSAE